MSVVVPFRGHADEAELALRALAGLRARPADELILADNTASGVAVAAAGADRPVRVVRAVGERSSYHARNVGAGASRNDWILFMDADCVPVPGLLDAYFAEDIADACGAIAGEIVGDPVQDSFLARYARSRNLLSQTRAIVGPDTGAAATGNLLVRRDAFAELGGFAEGIRSAGDVDLCRRLRGAGWTLEFRPAAVVAHRHRVELLPFLGQIARYGAGSRWLNQRYPGSSRRWPLLHGLAGSARDVAGHLVHGRVDPALFRAVDGLGLVAHSVGYLGSNRAPRLGR